MLNFLMEAIQVNFQQASAMGSSSRAQQALNELHTLDKTVEMTDQLMVSKGIAGLLGRGRHWLLGVAESWPDAFLFLPRSRLSAPKKVPLRTSA